MKKKGFSSEILCLFLIITSTIFFGKIVVDVKDIIVINLNALAPTKSINFPYQAYSYKMNSKIDKINQLNIIDNKEDLDNFIYLLNKEKVDIKWLNDKLKSYGEEFFKNKTILVINMVTKKKISATRINKIYKRSEESNIIIRLNQLLRESPKEGEYSWLAIVELEDTTSEIKILIDEM